MPSQNAALKVAETTFNQANTNEPVNMEKELNKLGLSDLAAIHQNLSPAELYEAALAREEVRLTADGAIVALTGQHTGRSAQDKYVVRDASNADHIDWGKVNQPYENEKFNALKDRIQTWLKGREVFVQDLYVGADPAHRLLVRVINTNAWHNLFARNMFIRPTPAQQAEGRQPDFTVLHTPEFSADPAIDATRSGTYVMLNFGQKLAIIGGTSYAGEIK